MSDQKPWESFQDQGATADSEQKPWESFGGETKPEGKGILGHARDLGLSAAKSVIAVPETAVGLLDIPTGGRVGKFLENEDGMVGFRPRQAKEYLSDLHTDQYKEQQQQFQDADGILDKAGVALSNPSMIANTVTESIAPMLAGGVAARGILATTKLGQMGVKGAATAGALGEGAVMAGAQAEAIRQETDDGLLTPGQSGAAVATGALGSVFGYAGGRLAQKLGIGDVDTMLARGITPGQVADDLASVPAKSIPRQVIEGAIVEGFFEELPQSVSETIIQNLALDKPWAEGVDEAIVMGTLAGMAMGGPAAGFSAMTRAPQPPAADGAPDATFEGTPDVPPQGPLPALPAPVYEAGQDGTVRTTDDLNAVNQAARQAEADRMGRIARGEVTDVTPIPAAPRPSEQMGLNPDAGPMSSAAALAVDSGATQQLAEQSALQQAAEIAQQQTKGKGPQPRQGEMIDGETGEIITTAQAEPVDRASELKERIDYIRNQARASGWDRRLVEAREAAEAELSTLQPQAKAEDAARQVLAAGGTEADASRAATDSLIGDMEKTPGISIASDAPAAVAAAVEKAKAPAAAPGAQDPRSGLEPPASVQEGIKQAQAKAKAKAAADAGQAAAPITAPAERSDGSTETVGDSGLVIVHGSGNPALTVDDVEIVRANGQKQGKKGRLYGGLYGTEEADAAQAEDYAKASGGEGGVFDVSIKPGTRVLNKTGDVTRLSKDYIDELVSQGYGVVKGTDPRGRTEVVVIDKNAIASLGKRAAKAPSSAQEGIEQVRTEKAEVSAAPADIKAVIAKQIPQMTDAELQQAVAHYGPEHKRTAKLNKELAKRGVQPSQQPTEIANATEPQGAGAPIQPTQGTQAAPLQEQPVTAAQSQPAPTDVAPAAPVADAGSRWDAMTPAERQSLAAKAGVKPVFAKNLPNAGWDRIGASVRAKLSEAMDPELTASLAESKSGAQELAARAAAYEARKIEGRDIGNGWAEFSKESGTLSVPRSEMPQIKAEHRGAMVNFLNARGIAHQEETVPATSLKPTQAEFSREKVAKAKAFEGGNRSILVSSDGHVLDGHHQWMASREKGEDVKVIRLDAPIRDLVQAAHEFPSSTTDQAAANAGMAPEAIRSAIEDSYYDQDLEGARQALRDAMPTEPGPGAKAEPQDSTPTVAAAPEAAPEKPAGYGAKNKLVSLDRREEIKRKLRGKAGQLNSGIDPEVMALGAELAVFHIEAGTRKFADFATAMVEDIGEKFIPYLRSFYDAARSFPGLDTEGMTPYDEAAKLHAAMLTPQVRESVSEAVGTVAEKPKARTKKTGAKGDMVLTQDWGVEHIDGYGQSDDREIGNDTKDAFLKEARNYLNATADALRAFGYEPHLDRKGKPEKPVSVNEAGPAVSGDVTLVMRNEESGNNVYITIGDTSLSGMVPSTPSGIAIMYRVGPGTDRYASKVGNTWAPVDLSANDLAALVYSRVRPAQENEARNEQPANGAQDQGRAQEVRGGRGDSQPGSAPADSGSVAPRQPEDGRPAGEAGDTGRSGVRVPGADVASGEGQPQGRAPGDGRARAGGAGSPDAGAGGAGSAGDLGGVSSPAATSAQAQDLHVDNPLEIVGGSPVQRFNRNRAALELLQTLTEEGRQATPDEQRVLAGYIGWGSFGQELFQGSWERPVYKDEGVWKERGQWLRDTLGESAWKSAQRSITNAHYTDPPTVLAMWDMVRRMGFEGGKVLEPSMGTGNFFSMMPADLKARSQLTGIELDETTGAIAKQLFPRSNVRIMGYQDSKTPDVFYDLVIGNWPFENTPVADRRYNKLNPMLHDYFFLKTMDQVRPGGIVIGITSAGSMDKQNTTIRRELAKQAELVAAIRLPSGAFEEYAGTKVVTDIVVLRKRPQRLVATPSDATWVETGDYKTPAGETIKVNRYYLDNPQNIIGTLDFGSGTTTFRAGMIVRRPENMAEQLQKAIELVPQGAMLPRGKVDHLTYYANETGERHGALALVNDRLMIAVGDQLVEANEARKYALKDAKKTAVREQQLRAAIELRKKHAALVDAERGGRPADDARKALRGAYDAFVEAHGGLRDSFALEYLERINDPFFAELAALENDDGTPAAVMERSTTRGRRTLDNPSVRDAYVLARNQSVNPSVAEVARLAGKSEQAVKAELLGSGAVFEAPNGDVVPSDIYLSGNVRQKLREAQAALDEGDAAMSANIAALKEVMPEDVPYFNIETQFGATWVPNEAYAQYIAHMLGQSSPKGIEVSFRAGRWKVKMEPGLSRIPEAAANYGTHGYPFSRLVQAAISNQVLRLTSKDENGNDVYDAARTEEANARIAKIREDFGAWLWSDPERRQDLEREYNEARNAWATPTYDGSFLTFEGMALTLGNGAFQLRQHQVNAIWRAIVNRRSINAHEVGTGKTFTMGGIAVESRRYGIAKKPMLLAHNANSATVAAEIRMMYPSARVLYVDNLQGDKKEIRLRQIANDDWDVIVVPHSLISSLALREETMMRMAEDDIKALEAEFFDAAREDNINPDAIDLDDDEDIAKIRSVTAKELAKARKRIIENIKKQAQKSSKEGAIAFEDLGVDMILVDEAHEFKKPPIVTRMKMKGLNTQVSNRSIALQFLTRYVRQMNNGGNVHTFTGTPITNTITEIYHQMRYVMEAEMEQATIADWDGWFGSFASEVQDVELTAAGDYEMVSRLAGFVNVPELRAMVGQYMDTVFAEDMPEMRPRKVNGKELSDPALTEAERAELLNGRTEGAKDRPYKKVVNDSADMTAEQMRIFTRLQQYAREWRAATGKQKKEWMRAGDPRSPIITEGIANKASFDVRLLDDEGFAGQEGRVPDEPTSKASRVVRNVLEIYNSNPNANQVIFSENGFGKRATRSAGSIDGEKQTVTVPVFATMHDIVERLVQGGIPREQIAVVDGSTSKERRKEIAEAMNASTIRVVIGSTDTLGVGVNMQRNLRAMHHVDAPYMPGELEQRNGRGLRQGNQWNTVLEYRYMTDRLDGKRWQILAVKQRFINAFMKAAAGTRVIEGEAAADEQSDILESFSEAAGDPRILQRVKMQKKLETLNRKERMYTQGIADMRRQERSSTELADRLTRELKQLADSRTQANIEALIAGQQQAFAATIDGTTYDTRKDAAEALQAFIEANVRIGDSMKTVGEYAGHPLRIEWPRHMDAPVTQIDAFGQEFAGKGIAGAEAKMRNFPSVIENKAKRRDMERSTAENMRAAMNQPFAQAADLERITKQLQDLEKDLEINPVPPPAWLRQGAPIDSEVHRNKRPYIVTGHRYSKEGWFVIAEDDKGTVLIPYMEATDEVGMPMYEEREFVPPVVIEKEKEGAKPADAPADVVVDRAAQSATANPLRNADGTFARQDPAGDSLAFSATLPRDRNAVRIGITEKGLVRAMRIQFDGLADITGKLLERGRAGKRGGAVVLNTADMREVGRIVAEKTGRNPDKTMRTFSSAGVVNGFYDPKSGLTFLVGPNLNPVTATAVLLHEVMHGQQRQKIDARALEMVRNRHSLKDEDLRAFLDRVMLRMIAAGEVGNAAEASAYIVEQAVIEGRSAGYTFADNAFMQWVDAKIGKRVGDFLRSFAGMIRTWMLRNGLGAKTMTVDDFVGYAMAGLDRAAAGEVRGRSATVSASQSQDRSVGDAPAQEAQRVQSAIEGKTLIEAAQFMTRSKDGAKAAVAQKVLEKLQRLEKAGVALDLKIVHRGDMAPASMVNARGYTETGFDEKGRDIVVWLNGADVTGKVGTEEEVLLHELVHAATAGMVFYGTQTPGSLAGKHARDLMAVTDAIAEHIRKRFDAADAGKATLTAFEQDMREGANNAFRSDDEVLAWALSSGEAQAYLETIPYRSGSMWSNFVQAVRNLLGLGARNDTALSEVLRVAERILTDDAPAAGRAAFWHKRNIRMAQQQVRGSIVQTAERGADDLQFSRSGMRELASRATAELNKTFTIPGKLHWWHKTIGTMYNLAERSPFFKPVFESAQGFIDDVAHYAADAAERAPKLLPRLETWRDIAKSPISADDNKAIAKPIFEGTLMWTRDDAGNPVRVQSLADAAANLTADEKADILLAQGKIPEGMLRAWKALSAEQYAKMIDSRYESQMLKPGIVWTDAELATLFKLNAEQVGLYHEFRDATNRSLDTMARADLLRFGGEDVKELRDEVMDAPDVRAAAMLLRDHLAKMADSWPDRATQLLQTAHGMMERADKVAELQGEGYAPLSRFGKYTVDVVENGERQYFGLFETKREANKMAEQMRAEFGQDSVTQGTLSDESFKLFAGITPESLELFGNMLGLDSTGDTAQDQAFQEYLRLTKTNRSAMRRLIHRKGIAGYSEDVGRVLASFVYSNARQTAAGLHMGDLGDAVNKIPKEQGELKDAAVRLSEYIKNPQEEAQAVRGLLFAQYLGGSVASAFVNMTQPFAVTFPWLSQHGGARKAAAELTKAAKQMSTKGHQYEADLAAALKDAEDDGVVSPQEVHQLMAQARGSGSLRAGDGTRVGEARAVASNAVARMSVAWGKLFGAAEQVNRRITFIAAYRVAKSQGMPDPDAFARNAVMETQFVYSKASKMQWGRGAIGGTLMTFKTYSVAYMELMSRLWTQGEPGSQERKEGRKAALLMIATLMLMGGAGGLPFAEDVEDLIDGLAQLAGYNFSTQKAKEAFLIDVFGEEIAHFIDKGVSGLPGAPMDVSGRFGMGNLIPGTGLFQERTSHTRDVLEIAGPMGDFANRIATGSRKILGGDVGAGLLEMSPVAVRNLAKGADMSVTGMYRDTKGYKVLDTNLLEAALKSVGFQPESVARVQEANWLNQRGKAFYNMKAQEIRSMWAAGIFEKDDAKVQRAREAIADWNAKNPEQPMLIRIPDIMRRVREMAKTKDQRIADTAPKAMRVQMREDVARLRSTMED